MLCPKCQGNCQIINSRHSSDPRSNHIPNRFREMAEQLKYRSHRCRKCDHVFKTIELTAEALEGLREKTKRQVIEWMISKLEES